MMMHSLQQHNVELVADGQALARITAEVSLFSARHSLDSPLARRLRLVLEELVANTIDHGGAPGGAILVSLRREPHAVVLDYRDHGVEFDPIAQPDEGQPALPVEDRRVGGLGWTLIRSLCSRLEYRREQDSNWLQLELPCD